MPELEVPAGEEPPTAAPVPAAGGDAERIAELEAELAEAVKHVCPFPSAHEGQRIRISRRDLEYQLDGAVLDGRIDRAQADYFLDLVD